VTVAADVGSATILRMTLKHDRESGPPDEQGVPDEKLDPIVSGWQTALGDKDENERERDDATGDEVARNDDLTTDRHE